MFSPAAKEAPPNQPDKPRPSQSTKSFTPDLRAKLREALKVFPIDGQDRVGVLEKFEENTGRFLLQTFLKRDNSVHLLAKWNGEWSPKKHSLLSWLLEKSPSLLHQQNHYMYTPVQVALVERQVEFVKTILSLPRLENFQAILEHQSPMGNCLHLAVEHDFPELEALIQRCDGIRPAFACQSNTEKDTPLHLAVKRLVLDGLGDDEWSDTAVFKEGLRQLGEQTERPRPSGAWSKAVALQDGAGSPPGHLSDDSTIQDSGLELGIIGEIELSAEENLKRVQLLVEACPNPLFLKNKNNRTPYQEREHCLLRAPVVVRMIGEYVKDKADQDDARMRAERRIVVEDPVAAYIRSFCVRDLPRELALLSLYQPGQGQCFQSQSPTGFVLTFQQPERHAEFDLTGMPTSAISLLYLEQLSKHLKFESILKYVALPVLDIESPPEPIRRRNMCVFCFIIIFSMPLSSLFRSLGLNISA